MSTVDYAAVLETLTDSEIDFIQKSNRLLIETNPASASDKIVSSNSKITNEDFTKIHFRQIMIWLPIGLALVLYFVIMAIIDMPITKSSMLYAKYLSSKTNSHIN